jgi:hypothetical protein
MFLIRLACLLSLLCLAACDRPPESYPPPEQRPPVEGITPLPAAMMVSMQGSDADMAIVKDIYPATDGINWRWTKQQPTVRVLVLSTTGIKYAADFSLWDDAFKITGPLEISFLVNGKLLDKVRYTTSGAKHFEKLVPADWLVDNTEATVGLAVDKLYTAPADGAKFGVILVRVGLKS